MAKRFTYPIYENPAGLYKNTIILNITFLLNSSLMFRRKKYTYDPSEKYTAGLLYFKWYWTINQALYLEFTSSL